MPSMLDSWEPSTQAALLEEPVSFDWGSPEIPRKHTVAEADDNGDTSCFGREPERLITGTAAVLLQNLGVFCAARN